MEGACIWCIERGCQLKVTILLFQFEDVKRTFTDDDGVRVKRVVFIPMRSTRILAACFIVLPTLYVVMFNLFGEFGKVSFLGEDAPTSAQLPADSNRHFFERNGGHDDNLLGGLLASGFDKQSCLSRQQSILYRNLSAQKPSPYLVSKLRSYENLHRRCGPHTDAYNRTLERLNSSSASSPLECSYVVWVALEGLGNRILTMASAFLYALLTNRVFLVEFESDVVDLFCEPFPNASWLLPADFPLKDKFKQFNQRYELTYGNMLKRNAVNESTPSPPSFMYAFLAHDHDDHDMLFYCNQSQALLQKVPWLIVKTDLYFIPSIFLMPSFHRELGRMFPDKETVFHHLGRYLFHPSNKAWGLITRFYESYLARADERIGIQIRVFDPKASPFQIVMDQIMACTLKEKLLPEVDNEEFFSSSSENRPSKAVLTVSLFSEFYEHIKNMYWRSPTVSGEIIGVYQPSHEGHQQFGDNSQNMKAWVEINLLSMCDVLVTSSWSTFGYVAQGLGGLRPWILHKPKNRMSPNPACARAMSMEPCLHFPPTNYECLAKRKVADIDSLVPHVTHCEDATSGLKLFNH